MPSSPIPDAVLKQVIDGYTSAIKPSVAFIVMGTLFSTMMIPMIVIMIYFSTPSLVRRPVFILNIFSLLGGVAIGVCNAYMEITSILSPFKGVSHTVYTGWTATYVFLPWLAEFALLFRLFAVYPPRRVGKKTVAAILIFPILLKITRFAVITAFLIRWVRFTSTTTDLIGAAKTVWLSTPYVRIDWTAQLVDNMYVSGLFLWKLHKDGRVFTREDTGVLDKSQESFTSRIRTLFWIAATNFILPVIFGVVQVAIVFADQDIYTSTYVLMANVYVVTISTVFATVWSSLSSDRTPSSKQKITPPHGRSTFTTTLSGVAPRHDAARIDYDHAQSSDEETQSPKLTGGAIALHEFPKVSSESRIE